MTSAEIRELAKAWHGTAYALVYPPGDKTADLLDALADMVEANLRGGHYPVEQSGCDRCAALAKVEAI